MNPVHRHVELDWLRGLMLVLMTVTHLPTWFSAQLGQPFGYVSAAEGFVFLSGILVGCVYTRIARDKGFAAMRRQIWRRTGKIYLAHVAVLLLLLWVIVPLAVSRGAHPVTDLASFYLSHPREALVAGLLLAYNPPLLDILPMYVLFMAVSPWLVECGTRRGWQRVIVASAGLWLVAQFGAGRIIYEPIAAAFAWPVPYNQTGSFVFLAWQLIWVVGLWLGSRSVDRQPVRIGTAPAVAAAAVALAFFAWRHWAGQVPADPVAVVGALDKWHLGALRLVDFGALLVLVVYARTHVVQWAQRSVLTTLGKASLTVFCAHLVICLVALAFVVDSVPARLHWRDSALLAATLVTLYAIALVFVEGKRIAPMLVASLSARLASRTAR
ncbi:MAG: OpgC domain-containing protein [Betaproteobacteria bacterium]